MEIKDTPEGNLYDIKKEFPSARWIYFHKKSKKITIPEQRNLGFKKIQANMITFINDNCIPVDNWLIKFTKPIKNVEKVLLLPH